MAWRSESAQAKAARAVTEQITYRLTHNGSLLVNTGMGQSHHRCRGDRRPSFPLLALMISRELRTSPENFGNLGRTWPREWAVGPSGRSGGGKGTIHEWNLPSPSIAVLNAFQNESPASANLNTRARNPKFQAPRGDGPAIVGAHRKTPSTTHTHSG